jgi:predicted DNA-binding transcriptional regulator AlpA
MADMKLDMTRLDTEELAALLGQVVFQILVRLATPAAASPVEQPAKLVNIAEASDRIGKSKSWLYRNARTLPFTRRIGGSLRFDTKEIEKWLRARQAS